MELYQANRQWAERPADERFPSLEAMHAVTRAYAQQAAEKEVPWPDVRVDVVGEDLTLVGKAGVPAILTHYAFGQLAARVGAPAGYLRGLPPTLAAQNLNHGLKSKGDGNALLLFHQNTGLVLRAATSERYARLWNHEVLARLIDLSATTALVPARQTMTWDGSPLPEVRPPALYASDHDMFAFVMTPERAVVDPVGKTLFRGLIVTNSEVGDRSLGLLGFWFRDLCTNHIIWGAEQIADIKLAHVGAIKDKWSEATVRARKYLDADTSFERAKFAQLTVQIAGTKETVLDTLFNRRTLGLSRKTLDAAWEAVVPEQDGDPRTVWGFAQGLTRHAQARPYADERYDLDRAAGKLLTLNF
jgi:hypothetical protein